MPVTSSEGLDSGTDSAGSRRDAIAKEFIEIERATLHVDELRAQVDSLGHYLNYNSAHGYFDEQTRLKSDLKGLRAELKMWETKYRSAALGLVK